MTQFPVAKSLLAVILVAPINNVLTLLEVLNVKLATKALKLSMESVKISMSVMLEFPVLRQK